MGHTVTLARNGAEAVAMWREKQHDVVLMDVQMPELDGFEATQQIRQLESESESHVPIIAMTAHAMQGDRERCVAAGMDDYVSKPVNRKILEQALERLAEKPMRAHASL